MPPSYQNLLSANKGKPKDKWYARNADPHHAYTHYTIAPWLHQLYELGCQPLDAICTSLPGSIDS